MKVYIELEVEVDYHFETDYIAEWGHSEEVLHIDEVRCDEYPDLDLSDFDDEITKQILEND